MSASPVLLQVTRNGVVESEHRGAVVLLDAAGDITAALGDATRVSYPRSSLKPLQAIALHECGYAGRDDALAIAAASHSGEPAHLALARTILASAGLDEAALRCPPDLPLDPAASLAWVRAGGEPAALCHNCSGKHAAMLATCAARGWALDAYLEPAHPLQQAIREVVERYCGEPIAASGVDGCGAPAHAVSLTGLARGFRAMMLAGTPAATAVRDAMRAHPYLVGGSGRPVTDLMAGVTGLLAKDGAEGVWAAALPDGRAMAAKIDDGAGRGLGPLLAAVLRHWGLGGAAVGRWSAVDVLGGGRRVGVIGCSASFS